MPAKRKAFASKTAARYSKKVKTWLRKRNPTKARFSQSININRSPVGYSREIVFPNLLIIPTTQNVFNSYYFTVAQLPNYTDFTSLFDQYRIRTVTMKFRLVAPPEANNTPVNQQFYPDIACTVDHDDNNTVTSMDTIYQYGKCKRGILRPNQWFTYKCHPTAALQLYRTATTTAYAPAKSTMWMDLAQTDCPYYGVKVGIDATAIGSNQTFNLQIEAHAVMYVEFKNSR